MIHYRRGNMFASSAEAIVLPVNIVGVPGAGVAKAAADMWPEWAIGYKQWCRQENPTGGDLHLHICEGPAVGRPEITVVSFATKEHWRNPSRIEWIKAGLETLRHAIETHGIRSIAIPALGCGLGGLAWSDVRPLIDSSLGGLDCAIEVYEPCE